jgi:hypothetical protein
MVQDHVEPSAKRFNEGGFGFQNRLLVHNITWLGQGVFTYENPSYN